MLKIISKFGIWHYAAIAIFSVGLFAFLFSQTNFNFLNAAETTIGTGGAPLPARSSTTYRGCWTNASASFAPQCDNIDINEDGKNDYSVCGYGETARCTTEFDATGDGTTGLDSDYDGQINDTVDHDGNSSTADQLITGYSLDCNTCRWTAPAPASCRDSQPDGNTATDDNDYETNCRYTGCTRSGGTLTCDRDTPYPSTCTLTSKSWSVSSCPDCSGEGTVAGKYQLDRYDYHCTTGVADGKKNKKYKSSTGDCKPPADDIEDCRDCIEDDYSNSCNYNYSQCRSQNGTKAKTCSLVTTECRYTRTFTSSSYTFPAESCRDCTANDYPRTDSNCTWDYSKCQQTEKTKRQTCSLATDQCKYTTTFTSTSYTYPAENCRDCVEGDFTSNCTWDTSTCSSNGTKSKTCGVATNQCRFTTTYPATPHTFTGIACTSCPDSSYTTNCTYGSQCLTSGANAGKVEKTCEKNSPDCAESTRVFYENCPDCVYNQWELYSNQCDPTVEKTPAQNGEVWKRTKNTTTSVSYCKALPTDENRSCSECSESQIYNCTPASWSGIQCTNGEKTRTCTKKALAIGNPGCSLPTQTRQRAITGNGTVYGQLSLTTGCSSGEGSSLPAGQSGSTMINISGSWAGSTNLFHNYNGADKRIGIGTTLPNTTLEIVSPDTTKSTQLRITDTNPAGATATTNPELQLQYGTGNNHWGMYVSNVALTTGTMPSPPITIASDQSFRIWNQSDLVRIKTDGTLYTSQICLTSTVTTDEAAGSSKCITSWPTGGGGGEQLWTKAEDPSGDISFSGGNVGIGTTASDKLLHLKTATGINAELDIQSGSKTKWGIYHDEATEDLRLWNNDDRVIITKSGNLGIDTSPSARLDIHGNNAGFIPSGGATVTIDGGRTDKPLPELTGPSGARYDLEIHEGDIIRVKYYLNPVLELEHTVLKVKDNKTLVLSDAGREYRGDNYSIRVFPKTIALFRDASGNPSARISEYDARLYGKDLVITMGPPKIKYKQAGLPPSSVIVPTTVSGKNLFYKITAVDGQEGETIGSESVYISSNRGAPIPIFGWYAVPGAVRYNIYRSYGPDFVSPSYLENVTETNYSDLGAKDPAIGAPPLVGTAKTIMAEFSAAGGRSFVTGVLAADSMSAAEFCIGSEDNKSNCVTNWYNLSTGGVNLIDNSSFELSTDGWINPGFSRCESVTQDQDAIHGIKAAKIKIKQESGCGYGIQTQINTPSETANKFYNAGFWIKAPNNKSISWSLHCGGSNAWNVPTALRETYQMTGKWQRIQAAGKCPDTSSGRIMTLSINFDNATNDEEYLIDSVNVSESSFNPISYNDSEKELRFLGKIKGLTLTGSTSVISPLFLGATTANSVLTLQGNNATSGNTPTSPNIQFKVGDNGALVAMTILNNGNVGIGTTTPEAKLSILAPGTSNTAGEQRIQEFRTSADRDWFTFRETAGADLSLDRTPDGGVSWYSQMFWDVDNGNVGVGTIAPEKLLHLKTTTGTNAEFDIQSGAKAKWGIYHDETTEDLRFWNTSNRLILAKNGSVSVGTATDDEAEVSRFIVKDASNQKGFYVGFEGNNTTLSTTPYPRLGASVKIDLRTRSGALGTELLSDNKIKLTYSIKNTGTRPLRNISVTDTHCPTPPMTSVNKPGKDKNIGDTSPEDGILNALPLGTVATVITNPPTPAPQAEVWEYTCTTGAITDDISMATSTVSVTPIKIDNSDDTPITDTAKWKATFDPMGAVPAYQQPQSMQERAVASAPAERAVSSLVAPKPVTNASAAIVITKFGAPSVVTIAWSNSSNATSYDVYRRTRSGSEGGWSSTKLNSHQSPVMDNVSIPKDTKDLEYQIVAINRYGETSIIVEVNVVRDSKSATNIEPHNNSSSPKTEPTPPETPLQTYTTTPVAPKAPLPKPESVPTPSTAPLPSQNPMGSGASSGGRAAPAGSMP